MKTRSGRGGSGRSSTSGSIGGGTNPLNEATAWLTEKLGRLKLERSMVGALGTFEALETLALGILGKLALWRALAVVAPADPRRLAARAQAQHARVEETRLEAARVALRPVESQAV